MNLKEFINYYIKGKNSEHDFNEINTRLPSNEVIASQVLKKLDNDKTKLKTDNDIKGNYYVFLNDTIYLSNKNKSGKEYSRITVICHECIHSIQSKKLQMLNFVLSNLEIVVFVICLILNLILKNQNYTQIIYTVIVVLSIIPRFILEIHASLGSISLTKKYIEEENRNKDEAEFAYNVVKFQVIALLPFMLLNLCLWKIVRTVALFII